MASSAVDICNLSLAFLKVDKRIVSIESPTKGIEEDFADWYDVVRKDALRSFPWSFARKRQQLTLTETQPVFGSYDAYRLPADYIRLVGVENSTEVGFNSFIQPDFYTIEGDELLFSNQFSVLTESGVLNLIYVYDLTEVVRMPSDFQTMVAMMLAHRLGYKFTQSNAAVQRIDNLLKDHMTSTAARMGQENPPKVIKNNSTLSSRIRPFGVGRRSNTYGFR